MALVVESGSGADSSANSYITVAECSTYHADMGNAAWAAASASPDTARENAVIRASRAIDRLYGRKFKGRQTFPGVQAMEWPRIGVYLVDGSFEVDEDEMPTALKHAACEAALRELAESGSMTPDMERGGAIDQVSAGSVSVTFAKGAPAIATRIAIDGILAPLLKPAGSEVILG